MVTESWKMSEKTGNQKRMKENEEECSKVKGSKGNKALNDGDREREGGCNDIEYSDMQKKRVN